MNYELVGKRIRQQRTSKNLSQQELADCLHFSHQHLSNVERGLTGISLELLVQVSNLLEVPVEYFLQDSLVHSNHFDESFLLSNVESYVKMQQSTLIELQNLIETIKYK